MTKSTQDAALLRQRAGTPMDPVDPDTPITEVTAARLRDAAEKAGEPFDGRSLTEAQARERLRHLEAANKD
ncbi:hypothetical protein [Pseudaestuariivita atlantica]|uniref:DUF3072 domain-containing protein n=1 Tax=Pseudaestuariivita atlantica TaxID=1317121 RepID=A0A0L1JTV4_9RHOB|nr:hypothetical protein [Pseudaestuariivita atlantica]KNG95180.1 hypothetical protein ATO11_00585 [Pseudaestuariivita atlantica]